MSYYNVTFTVAGEVQEETIEADRYETAKGMVVFLRGGKRVEEIRKQNVVRISSRYDDEEEAEEEADG